MSPQDEITGETTLEEVMQYPGATEILAKFGLPCLWCPMAAVEIGALRLGQVARTYGIDAEKLIRELNEKIKPEKEE